jgi:hypothetical protein
MTDARSAASDERRAALVYNPTKVDAEALRRQVTDRAASRAGASPSSTRRPSTTSATA